jgi:hypothetical protein
LQLALARLQRDVSICTFVPSNAIKLSSTLQLAVAGCRIVLSALHQLLHYSTQFTFFTGTSTNTDIPRCGVVLSALHQLFTTDFTTTEQVRLHQLSGHIYISMETQW